MLGEKFILPHNNNFNDSIIKKKKKKTNFACLFLYFFKHKNPKLIFSIFGIQTILGISRMFLMTCEFFDAQKC